MWLDRLSGHSTPSTPSQSRAFSPAPRRPSHLGPNAIPSRSGYSPRSSSLSLPLNSSSSSLPSTARQPNGSALRHSTVHTPTDDIPDPLDVLQGIVGRPLRTKNFTPEEKDLGELDFAGLSLKELARVEGRNNETRDISASKTPSQSVEEYEREKDKFEDLHRSIAACDEVLKSVNMYLGSFQSDLGAVSTEIESLQNRSSALSTRLENRKTVEKLLGPAVEEISISPAIVRKISDGPIDDSWVKALAEVEKRNKTVESRANSEPSIKAVKDIQPILKSLISRALERIRDYLVAQIKALRSPNINAQIIQQQSLLKYKDLFSFLAKHHPKLAEEVSQAYINTMRWYYTNHFTRYQKALEKIRVPIIDKNDVFGPDESSRKGNVAQASLDAHGIGRRMELLKTDNRTAISSYLAEEDKSAHYLEVPFRNFNLALLDNASTEYSFLTEFFSGNTFHQVSRKFTQIFEPTFVLGHSLTKSLIEPTVDCLGTLLCVRLNQHFAFELQRRKVPAMDSYINGTNMLLWPRFQVVMDSHCDSIRRAGGSTGRSAMSALTLTAADTAKQSAAPHALTQRFAQLLHGILALSSEAGDDEPVSNSLSRLRKEYEVFLEKVSKAIGDVRKRERFLYNNYSLVLTIIDDVGGKLALGQQQHFTEMRDSSK